MKLAIFIILSAFYTAAYAQEIPILTDNSLPGIEKITTRHFDYDGLWGYINGGADLYFEYGFKSVTVQDVEINGSDFKVDIYLMKSPEAAYGIYSVSRFRCLESNFLTQHDCMTPYQYIAASGKYFISIANNTGSKDDQLTSQKFTKEYLDQIEETKLQVPDIFNHSLFEPNLNDLKLIFGPLGMQNGFVRWDGLFAGFSNYEAWIIPCEFQDQKFNVGLIRFENNETLNRFLEKNTVMFFDHNYYTPSAGIKYYALLTENGLLLFDGEMSETLFNQLSILF